MREREVVDSFRDVVRKGSKELVGGKELMGETQGKNLFVGIDPLNARHDVTMLDLTIHLLSFWCIGIDLSIQLMSLTLYMTCVH